MMRGLIGFVLLLATGCAATPPGASDASLAQAQSRAASGAGLYQSACADCHGPRGEGLAGAPPIIGATALPRYPRDQSGIQLYQDPEQIQRQAQLRVPGAASRQELVSARDLQQYLKLHVSELNQPAMITSLKEPDLWAIVEFILIAQGSDVPAAGISPDNAGSVLIRGE
jgi:cytochrome c